MSSKAKSSPRNPIEVEETDKITKLGNFARPFECKICPMTYMRKQDLSRHNRAKHGVKYETKCDFCDCTFTTKAGSKRHRKRTHKNDPTVSCSMCENMQRPILGRHEVVDTTPRKVISKPKSNVRPFQCPICKKEYTLKRSLSRHISLNHSQNNNIHCKICHISFSQQHGLLRHVKSVHERLKRFECYICHKTFTRKFGCQVHIRMVHKSSSSLQNAPMYKCHLCERLFENASMRDSHLFLNHSHKQKYEVSENLTENTHNDGTRKVFEYENIGFHKDLHNVKTTNGNEQCAWNENSNIVNRKMGSEREIGRSDGAENSENHKDGEDGLYESCSSETPNLNLDSDDPFDDLPALDLHMPDIRYLDMDESGDAHELVTRYIDI